MFEVTIYNRSRNGKLSISKQYEELTGYQVILLFINNKNKNIRNNKPLLEFIHAAVHGMNEFVFSCHRIYEFPATEKSEYNSRSVKLVWQPRRNFFV